MRVIAGELKGRKLVSPKDERVRPTSDKVKEAIFSMITDTYYDEPVIDVFAGTGNLGIEAISRGAKHCYFGDRARDSIGLIKENITNCKIQDRCTILAGDYETVLKRVPVKAQIIFLDPPYSDGLMIPAIELISQLDLLKEDGYIIAEHSIKEELPETIGGYEKIKEKRYGKIAVSIFG